MNRNLALAGRWIFALCLIAFGVQNFYYRGDVNGVLLTPPWLPPHLFWAWVDGAVLIAGALAIATGFQRRAGAIAVSLVYFGSVVLIHLPNAAASLHDIGLRTVVLEALAIGCSARFICGLRGPDRILFGIAMAIFGLDHFPILKFIASLIPSWMPGAMFLAWFTGFAMLAAGIAIVFRWKLPLSAGLLGLMFFLFVVTLHAPRVAKAIHNGNEWNSLFVALAVCGASWALTEEH